MRKVWNAQKKAYDYLADGIYVDGQDYDKTTAYQKWLSRRGASKCGTTRAKQIIRKMIDDGASFNKHHHWLEEMEHQILLANHDDVEIYKGKSGTTGTVDFSSIPSNFRAGILAIANGTAGNTYGTGNYFRSAHTTCPAKQTGGVTSYKEYHLRLNGEEGRATSAKSRHGNKILIYYSTGHAFGTYSYHLVTIPITIDLGNDSVTKPVPLHGGPRDGLITLPVA